MATRYSPHIITDGIVALLDPTNPKCQNSIPIINRSNFPTNWYVARSIITNVTGSIAPPSSLPQDTTVLRLDPCTSLHANGLHRAQNGSAGFVSLDPDLTVGGTRYNLWAKGEVGNTDCTIVIDIGDDPAPNLKAATINDNTEWQYLSTWNTSNNSATEFFDIFITPYTITDDYSIYICGDTIAQSNTDISINQQELTIDPVYIEKLGTKGVTPKDMVVNNNWTIYETKWDINEKFYKFDNTGMYISSNFNTPENLQGDSTFSVMQAIRRTSTIVNSASWGIGGSASNAGFSNYTFINNGYSFDQWGSTTIYVTGETMPLNEWVLIHWLKTVDGSTSIDNLTFYINENSYTGSDLSIQRSANSIPNINSDGLVIGRAGVNTDNYYINNADIGITMFYDKVLSHEEVLHNVDIFKLRYGIL